MATNETVARWYALAHASRLTYNHAKQALFGRDSNPNPNPNPDPNPNPTLP